MPHGNFCVFYSILSWLSGVTQDSMRRVFFSVNCVPSRDEQASRATIRLLICLWTASENGGGVGKAGKGHKTSLYRYLSRTIPTGFDGRNLFRTKFQSFQHAVLLLVF